MFRPGGHPRRRHQAGDAAPGAGHQHPDRHRRRTAFRAPQPAHPVAVVSARSADRVSAVRGAGAAAFHVPGAAGNDGTSATTSGFGLCSPAWRSSPLSAAARSPRGRAETPTGAVRVSSAWCCLPRPSAVTPLAVFGLFSLVDGVPDRDGRLVAPDQADRHSGMEKDAAKPIRRGLFRPSGRNASQLPLR